VRVYVSPRYPDGTKCLDADNFKVDSSGKTARLKEEKGKGT
jgi:hypothetical protein